MKNAPINLGYFKDKADKLDVDKLVPVPVDLNKLIKVVTEDVLKKDAYNALIKNIEDKIPDATNLTTNTNVMAKINELKTKYLVLLT